MNYTGKYINLAKAKQRNDFMQTQLTNMGVSAQYERFEGIVKGSSGARIVGQFSPREQGCRLSHLGIMEQVVSTPTNDALHILEDDALLHPSHHLIVQKALQSLANTQWDILFTGATFIFFEDYIPLFDTPYQDYIRSNRQNFCLLNLGKIQTNGAYSYIINPRSLSKIHNLVANTQMPIDFIYRQLIGQKVIKAFCVFPTLAKHNYEFDSTIEEKPTDWVLHGLYQRLYYKDEDLEQLYEETRKYGRELGMQSEIQVLSFASLLQYFIEMFGVFQATRRKR